MGYEYIVVTLAAALEGIGTGLVRLSAATAIALFTNCAAAARICMTTCLYAFPRENGVTYKILTLE